MPQFLPISSSPLSLPPCVKSELHFIEDAPQLSSGDAGGHVKTSSADLTTDEGKAVGREDGVHGLEVSSSASAAVARSTGGDTLSLGTRVERTARVTRLSADGGAGKATDGALSVVDSDAVLTDSTAVDTGGGARAADGSTDSSDSAARDGEGAASVVVDAALEGVAGAGADPGVVVAGEGGAGEGSERGTAGGGGGGTDTAAVAGGDETGGNGETDGAARAATDEVGITTADGGEGLGEVLNSVDLELGLSETNLSSQGLGLGSALGKGLKDNLVGLNIDVPGGNAGGRALDGGLLGEEGVKSLLGLLELGEAVGDNDGGGTGSLDLLDEGLISDGDADALAVVSEPGAGESLASGALQGLDDIGRVELASDASVGLLRVEAEVALHGLEHVGVKAGGGGHKGRGGGNEAEELGELHCDGQRRWELDQEGDKRQDETVLLLLLEILS